MPNLAAIGAVVDELGEEYEILVRQILDRYFLTVHRWLPMVSSDDCLEMLQI